MAAAMQPQEADLSKKWANQFLGNLICIKLWCLSVLIYLGLKVMMLFMLKEQYLIESLKSCLVTT